MIKPSIGRVVWFYARGTEQRDAGEQPEAAIVAFVHSDDCINLMVISEAGTPRPMTSVALMQEEDFAEGVDTDWPFSFATWMPYQQAQAKKHEASS